MARWLSKQKIATEEHWNKEENQCRAQPCANEELGGNGLYASESPRMIMDPAWERQKIMNKWQ